MQSLRRIFLLVFCFVFFLSLTHWTFPDKPYDLVINNSTIIDASGNPRFKADIGPEEEKTVAERLEDKIIYEQVNAHIIERKLASTGGIDKAPSIYVGCAEKFPENEGKKGD